ncbi:ESF2 [Candida oxycetoniae]|uniref:Pre-rRNA-processing protein ESF2 n=1 Tax=Candida oxycetoniae TaxID=497107 RepID=A0AAI9SWQ6_9ASCO|nr:ESF2 [Candida oxycetoniae]KAI3404150.2 ESF2 [Candida oxycetoniae]
MSSPRTNPTKMYDLEEDFISDDDEVMESKVFDLRSKTSAPDRFSRDEEQDSANELSDNESDEKDPIQYQSEIKEVDEAEKQPEMKTELEDKGSGKAGKKLKKFTPEELAKEQKRIRKTGVCYLSKVPPYMKPQKLRSILSRFGSVDRLFLKPEEASAYHKRVKYGGNKKKKFTEGWIEFVNKKDAKLCAATLNGNKLGGKKTSYYYDDVINIKYLKGFKWLDLTQQIASENEVRQAKLALELSHQNRFNKAFVNNVEKAKMITNIQKKRGNKSSSAEDDKLRRNFKQRKVNSSRSDAASELKQKSVPDEKLSSVLSKVF